MPEAIKSNACWEDSPNCCISVVARRCFRLRPCRTESRSASAAAVAWLSASFDVTPTAPMFCATVVSDALTSSIESPQLLAHTSAATCAMFCASSAVRPSAACISFAAWFTSLAISNAAAPTPTTAPVSASPPAAASPAMSSGRRRSPTTRRSPRP